MTLKGFRAVPPSAPVCHISYFEADAFARWAGKRLPTEFEWEVAAEDVDTDSGRDLTGRHFVPLPAPRRNGSAGLKQMFGDVWEWT